MKVESNNLLLESNKRDFQNLYTRHQQLRKSLKSNELKINAFDNNLNKKIDENERQLAEYTKTLEKDSQNLKKIQELEAEKKAIQLDLDNKNTELNYVRDLNRIYETKADYLPDLEKRMKVNKQTNFDLKHENKYLLE